MYIILLVDTYLWQREDHSEQIASVSTFESSANRQGFLSTVLYTKSGREFVLPEGRLSDLKDTARLTILTGYFTNYGVDVVLTTDNSQEVYATSFLKRTIGGSIVSLFTAIAFLVLSVQLIRKRKVNGTAFSCSLFLLCFIIYSILVR